MNSIEFNAILRPKGCRTYYASREVWNDQIQGRESKDSKMEPSGVHRGWGDNSLSKVFPYYKLEELVMIAFKNMLEDNDLKMDPLEVKGLINFASYGEFADHFQDQQYFVSSGKRRGNGSQVTL